MSLSLLPREGSAQRCRRSCPWLAGLHCLLTPLQAASSSAPLLPGGCVLPDFLEAPRPLPARGPPAAPGEREPPQRRREVALSPELCWGLTASELWSSSAKTTCSGSLLPGEGQAAGSKLGYLYSSYNFFLLSRIQVLHSCSKS